MMGEVVFGISIGKYEITKLKDREKAIMQELESYSYTATTTQNNVSNIFDFKAIRLQQELKLLKTRLKIMGDDDNDIA